MSLTDKMKPKLLDGQELFFLNNEQWDEILKMEYFNGVGLTKRLIQRINLIERPIANKYQELLLVGWVGGFRPHFFSQILLNTGNNLYRIYLEQIKCAKCNWSGYFGNPFVSDMYFGIPKNLSSSEIMQKARELPRVPCPNCGEHFDRPAVWVGKLPNT